MRFQEGYVKLYRSAAFEDIGRSAVGLGLWSWLLCAANRFESKIRWNGAQRVLRPGELLVDQRRLAADLDLARTTLQRHLKYLSDTGRIQAESGPHGTIITILNYSEYQDEESASGPQPGQERAVDAAANAAHIGELRIENKRIPGPKVQKPDAYSQEFEGVYTEYPRKEGKKGGWKIYKREITTDLDRETLLKAIRKYRAMNAGKEKEYLKHFDTFMNNWRDYVPTELSTPVDNSVGNQALMSLVASRKFLKPIGE